MAPTEIRIAGFGGQGVILAGMVIGRAATIYDGKYVTLTQSFGPEARGSACSCQLIVSPEPVLYPYVTHPDILVVMSQEACTRFCPELQRGGLLLYEEQFVKLTQCNIKAKRYGIPATRFAEELGRKMVMNMVMVGFIAAMTELASPESVRKAIQDSVPKGTEPLNLKAFEIGVQYGQGLLAARQVA